MAAPMDQTAYPPQADLPAAPAKPGPIDNKDVDDWKNRFNHVLGNAGEVVNSKSGADAADWSGGFFGCCNPIDTCLITYCCPCVTFGKIHHRYKKNGSLEGYEPINTSCLLFIAAACVGFHWVPEAMQRAELRAKYNLKGDCITDIFKACCCALCDLVQQEKETVHQEKALLGAQQYSNGGNSMMYAAPGEKDVEISHA